MANLQLGQKFSFKKIQSGGVYYLENRGNGPYAVPAKYYQEFLSKKDFIDRMGFTGAEIFEVVEAQATRKGWHVIGKMLGSDIRVSFYQGNSRNGRQFVEVRVH